MDAKEFLKAKGIHPTEPIYWDTTDKHGDRYIELHELMEEYASQTEMPSEEDAIKIISTELSKCFSMGLKQSPNDAENSEFYAPLIDLTIAPKLWEKLKSLTKD